MKTLSDDDEIGALNRRRNWQIRISICVISIVVVSIVGPFSTFEHFPLGQRFLYWGAVIMCSFFAAYYIRLTLRNHIPGSELFRDIVAAFGIGVLIAPWVWWANSRILTESMGNLALLFEHMVLAWLISFTPVLMRTYYRSQLGAPVVIEKVTERRIDLPPPAAPDPDPVDHATAQPLLRHVEPEKRGPIRRVSAAGHQLMIFTEHGETCVRMRFSDALNQLGSADGFQVHRSHWVAKDEIERFEQAGRKFSVTLESGTILPVSSTRATELQKSGIQLQGDC